MKINSLNAQEIKTSLIEKKLFVETVFMGVDQYGASMYSYIIKSPNKEGGIFLETFNDYQEIISS